MSGIEKEKRFTGIKGNQGMLDKSRSYSCGIMNQRDKKKINK